MKEENLTHESVLLVTQFIGEWTFHKSIDLINSKIPVENREPILQIIAANIFNTAKLAIMKNLPQDQLISLVETKVTQVYNSELEKLVQRGILTQEQSNAAANQSNLNDMVQKTQDAEKLEEATNAVRAGADNASSSDKKSLKFVALAILLKHLGEEKAQEILSAFDEQDARHIYNYMKMSDIENKVDPMVVLKSLTEIKKLIPISDTINVPKLLTKFHRIIKAASPEILNNISINERENVRDFILDTNFPVTEVFSPQVIKSVVNTLEEKINDN